MRFPSINSPTATSLTLRRRCRTSPFIFPKDRGRSSWVRMEVRLICAVKHSCRIDIYDHSGKVNVVANSRGQTSHLESGHRCPYQGKRRVSQHPHWNYIPRHRMVSPHLNIHTASSLAPPGLRCLAWSPKALTPHFRAMNPVVRGDIVVSDFLNSVGGYRYKERRDRLLDILDVDLDWHMHQISDGERRRVQLVMGLMGDWDVLLLDEVSHHCFDPLSDVPGKQD